MFKMRNKLIAFYGSGLPAVVSDQRYCVRGQSVLMMGASISNFYIYCLDSYNLFIPTVRRLAI